MKTNLKTFPKRENYPKEACYQMWREDFEAELRQQIYCHENCSLLHKEAKEERIKTLKEILGE